MESISDTEDADFDFFNQDSPSQGQTTPPPSSMTRSPIPLETSQKFINPTEKPDSLPVPSSTDLLPTVSSPKFSARDVPLESPPPMDAAQTNHFESASRSPESNFKNFSSNIQYALFDRPWIPKTLFFPETQQKMQIHIKLWSSFQSGVALIATDFATTWVYCCTIAELRSTLATIYPNLDIPNKGIIELLVSRIVHNRNDTHWNCFEYTQKRLSFGFSSIRCNDKLLF